MVQGSVSVPTSECLAGSLISVLELLEASLGLPATLVAALRQARENRLAVAALWTSQSDGISPTLPFSLGDTQLPVVGHFQLATAQRHLGLSARFILDFARALLQCASSTSVAEQVKVVCKGSVLDFPDCQVCTFFPAGSPIWIFFLVNSHWTLVKCQQEGDSLAVLQFDGLAWTSLSELAPLVATLKKAWHVQSVHIRSVWDFPQQRSDSCGTIALAHFAYQIGSSHMNKLSILKACMTALPSAVACVHQGHVVLGQMRQQL